MIISIEADFIDPQSGYRCVVLLLGSGPMHWRTGYVAVPKTNKLFGRQYNALLPGKTVPPGKEEWDCCQDRIDSNIPVHGGLTYSSERGGIGTYPVPYDPTRLWWFGFDANHYQDSLESCPLPFMKEQCSLLARQLVAYEPWWRRTLQKVLSFIFSAEVAK